MGKKQTTNDEREWVVIDEGMKGATALVQAGNATGPVGNQIGIEAIVKTVNTNHKGTVIALAGCVFATPEERLLIEELVREKDVVIVTVRPREPKML